jgi:hypothetical protein
MTRESAKDDVIPLSKPITTASGEVVNEIPVPKGMKFMLSIPAYNRHVLFYSSLFAGLIETMFVFLSFQK